MQARSVREPIPDLLTSSATRPGVAGLYKYLANECAADGVLINTIVPGRIDTDRFRQGVARAAVGVGLHGLHHLVSVAALPIGLVVASASAVGVRSRRMAPGPAPTALSPAPKATSAP